MKRFILLLYVFFAPFCLLKAAEPEIFNDIVESIKVGDAKSLAKNFNTTIDLTIIAQENTYSKTQAEQVIRDFFATNKPQSFNLIHQGLSKEGAKYAIGSLVTTQGKTYRVYMYIKQVNGSFLINELRFMQE